MSNVPILLGAPNLISEENTTGLGILINLGMNMKCARVIGHSAVAVYLPLGIRIDPYLTRTCCTHGVR